MSGGEGECEKKKKRKREEGKGKAGLFLLILDILDVLSCLSVCLSVCLFVSLSRYHALFHAYIIGSCIRTPLSDCQTFFSVLSSHDLLDLAHAQTYITLSKSLRRVLGVLFLLPLTHTHTSASHHSRLLPFWDNPSFLTKDMHLNPWRRQLGSDRPFIVSPLCPFVFYVAFSYRSHPRPSSMLYYRDTILLFPLPNACIGVGIGLNCMWWPRCLHVPHSIIFICHRCNYNPQLKKTRRMCILPLCIFKCAMIHS